MSDFKRTDAQMQLPEPIIQHIQSFLNAKQSASTAILSKSWYNSWLTNPNLDFDERHFQKPNTRPSAKSVDTLLKIVNATLERYRKSKLRLHTFKLSVTVSNIKPHSPPINELIVKALKMGANVVHLDFRPPSLKYPLPGELFRAEFLVDLSVVGGRIYGAVMMCRRLKSLSLSQVCIEDGMVNEIVSRCPLIENLFLSDCEGLVKVNVSRLGKLERLTVVGRKHTEGLMVPAVVGPKHTQGLMAPTILIETECRFLKLGYLLLERVKIDDTLFSDFSKKFPCIQDLVIRYCDDIDRFDISSGSLKYITLATHGRSEIHLDVSSICKFTYTGSTLPTSCLIIVSKAWESEINLSCPENINASWFSELNRFLKNLHLSKNSLSLRLPPRSGHRQYINCFPDIQGLPWPMVENLILEVHPESVWTEFLDGVFGSLRPKIVSLLVLSGNRVKASNEILLLLCKKLMDLENFICCDSAEEMIELEEVSAECFDDISKEWITLSWKDLVHALVNPERKDQIHYRLKWGKTRNP